MPQWPLRIALSQDDVAAARLRFQYDECRFLSRNHGEYYLGSSEFKETDDRETIVARGISLCSALSGAGRVLGLLRHPIEARGIIHENADGTTTLFIEGTIRANTTIHGTATVRMQDGNVKEPQTSPIERHIRLAE